MKWLQYLFITEGKFWKESAILALVCLCITFSVSGFIPTIAFAILTFIVAILSALGYFMAHDYTI